MEHGEVTHSKGFGHKTNGVGLLIITIVAVCLTLFCWVFWKDGSKEINHYRLNSQPTHATGEGNGHGEHGVKEASPASHPVEATPASGTPKADTLANTASATDSSHHADSSHH